MHHSLPRIYVCFIALASMISNCKSASFSGSGGAARTTKKTPPTADVNPTPTPSTTVDPTPEITPTVNPTPTSTPSSDPITDGNGDGDATKKVVRTIEFTSSADKACNTNCLWISVNGSEMQKMGCNKTYSSGCTSPGGLVQTLSVNVYPDRCNHITFKMTSGAADVYPLSRGPGKGYKVLSRTPNTLDVFFNDNNDNDVHDFRAKLTAPSDTTFGFDGMVGAECSN